MFGDHDMHGDSEGTMFLICHVTSCHRTFKRLCEFIGGSYDLAKFGGHWSRESEDMKHLICHVTSKKSLD